MAENKMKDFGVHDDEQGASPPLVEEVDPGDPEKLPLDEGDRRGRIEVEDQEIVDVEDVEPALEGGNTGVTDENDGIDGDEEVLPENPVDNRDSLNRAEPEVEQNETSALAEAEQARINDFDARDLADADEHQVRGLPEGGLTFLDNVQAGVQNSHVAVAFPVQLDQVAVGREVRQDHVDVVADPVRDAREQFELARRVLRLHGVTKQELIHLVDVGD